MRVYLGALLALICLLPLIGLGQTGIADNKAQEAFAIALAEAHSRTHLIGQDMKPFRIHAEITSDMAIRAAGNGTFDTEWVDGSHWKREIHFADFQGTELRNDEGHPWIRQSTAPAPIRISEISRYLFVHLPNSASAEYQVTESPGEGQPGQTIECYSTTRPTPRDGFTRFYRWCFDSTTGLLASEDLPLDTHVAFEKYVSFQGKQVPTSIRAMVGNIPSLRLNVSYFALDADALDTISPSADMKRVVERGPRPNPEDWTRGTVLQQSEGALPPDTPAAYKHVPVAVHIALGEDGHPFDIAVEEAPTEAMAQAALKAAMDWVYQPFRLKGQAERVQFFATVKFSKQSTSSPDSETTTALGPVSQETLAMLFKLLHLNTRIIGLERKNIEQQQSKLPPWYPIGVWNAQVAAVLQINPLEIAFPIYQKHLSEQDAQKFVELLSTPEGQELIQHVFDLETADIEAGRNVREDQKTILDEAIAQGRAEHLDTTKSLDSSERKAILAWAQSLQFQQAVAGVKQIFPEFQKAVDDKGFEVADTVALAHKKELQEAHNAYESSHPH